MSTDKVKNERRKVANNLTERMLEKRETDFQIVGKLMRDAMERRKDRPKLALMEYMKEQLEGQSTESIQANLPAFFKNARKIWEENL